MILTALSLTAVGCGEDTQAKSPDPEPACKAGALEADLMLQPLIGPGVDPAADTILPPPDGSSYVVSATYGVPRPEDGVMERYKKLFGAIEAQLMSQEGMLALRLAVAPSCGSGRTLAVWASEEAMYAFVSSQAHADAMLAAGEVLQPGYATTHWEATTAAQITLEEGAVRLAATASD